MRSFVYLPLISTIVSLAFAMNSQEENTSDLAGKMTSEVNVEPASGSGQNSPQRHQEDSSTLGSGQNSPQRHQEVSSTSFMTRLSFGHSPDNVQLPPGSPGSPGSPRHMLKYGYLCQESMYPMQHLIKTATRACEYITNKRQTNGRFKYPRKMIDDNQSNTQYLFPVLPENKIFSGGYFEFGLRLRHFLLIDSACERAKVTYRVLNNPRKSTKNWCSWPKCFSKGISQYFDCPAFYLKVDSSQPDYFQLFSN